VLIKPQDGLTRHVISHRKSRTGAMVSIDSDELTLYLGVAQSFPGAVEELPGHVVCPREPPDSHSYAETGFTRSAQSNTNDLTRRMP